MMRIVLALALLVTIAWLWLSHADDFDDAFAQFSLGVMYDKGRGVLQSNEELRKRGLDRLL